MKGILRRLDSLILSGIDFAFATKYSLSGAIVFGGFCYYVLATDEWRKNRRRAKAELAFYRDDLKRMRKIYPARDLVYIEKRIAELEEYQRTTRIPSFHPRPVSDHY
jgi:hypothetical protein